MPADVTATGAQDLRTKGCRRSSHNTTARGRGQARPRDNRVPPEENKRGTEERR